MTFPNSPADGDSHVENGRNYVYDSSANGWLVANNVAQQLAPTNATMTVDGSSSEVIDVDLSAANTPFLTTFVTADHSDAAVRFGLPDTATESKEIDLVGFENVGGGDAHDRYMIDPGGVTEVRFTADSTTGLTFAQVTVLTSGAPPAPAWAVTWTDGNTFSSTDAATADGAAATYGTGVVQGGNNSPVANFDNASVDQPVIRLSPGPATSVAESITEDSYVQFDLTGTDLDAASVTFDFAGGGASQPRGWDLRSSADGYAASLGTGTATSVSPSMDPVSVDVSSIGAETNLSFRVYVHGPSSGSIIYVDNFEVTAA